MAERVPHAVRVEVEVPQGLVPGDAAHLLQAPGQVLGQGPHGHALDLPVHDDGARGQALRRGTPGEEDGPRVNRLRVGGVGPGTSSNQTLFIKGLPHKTAIQGT